MQNISMINKVLVEVGKKQWVRFFLITPKPLHTCFSPDNENLINEKNNKKMKWKILDRIY